MNPPAVTLPSELARFVESSGESGNIDFKASIAWDGAKNSASLAKDIAAFANSRDGGVIVIGKSEARAGVVLLDGVPPEVASTFETTKVSQWVNAHFAPPIHFTCHAIEHKSKTFIVITIDEFPDIPHICTKAWQEQSGKNEIVLRKGSVYVRTTAAASGPLQSADDLRTLVGLATRKRLDDMHAMLNSVLSGRALLPTPSDEEDYEREFREITTGWKEEYKLAEGKGAWIFRSYPSKYVAGRWQGMEDLLTVMRRCSARYYDEFPPLYGKPYMREWGLCNDMVDGKWTLSRSGQFLCLIDYWGNRGVFKSKWRNVDGRPAQPDLPAGQWLDYQQCLLQIFEYFAFLGRWAKEFELKEDLIFEVRATAIKGRLLTSDGNINLRTASPTQAEEFVQRKRIPATDFTLSWDGHCAEAMRQFVELFMGNYVSLETFLNWINRFKMRK